MLALGEASGTIRALERNMVAKNLDDRNRSVNQGQSPVIGPNGVPAMSRLLPALVIASVVSFGAACARSSHMPPESPERTVLKVENQGFPDMNIYVVPDASTRVRLGTVTGNTNGYFTLPDYLIRGTRELRFQALPIATQRGPVSQSIMVTPGDTVVLIIPPTG